MTCEVKASLFIFNAWLLLLSKTKFIQSYTHSVLSIASIFRYKNIDKRTGSSRYYIHNTSYLADIESINIIFHTVRMYVLYKEIIRLRE